MEVKKIPDSPNFWALPLDESISLLDSSPLGLSIKEASSRFKKYGPNLLPTKSRLSRFKIFFDQLKSPLIFILIIASFVTLFLNEIKDAIVIFLAVIVNSTLGFYQENKAENSLSELKNYLKRKTVALRGGESIVLDSDQLVPGDVILLNAGNRIPADARLISSSDLSLDEAILTGESLPVKKNIHPVSTGAILAERSNMVWSGTLVFSGTAKALVVSTGLNTELGRIASLVSSAEDEATPLQLAINQFTIKVSIALLSLTAILFGLGIYSGVPVFDMFLTSVAVAVSAIPEGLPIALTVVLAIGVERMAKRKGIVRKLLAAETLGSTTLVLTDKTGTLTEAQTSLSQVVPVSGKKADEKQLLEYAALNVSSFTSVTGSSIDVTGRPLEVSLLKGVRDRHISLSKLLSSAEIINQLPFNSRDKFSATLVNFKRSKKHLIIFLGAPDILLSKSSTSKNDRQKVLTKLEDLAYAGEKLVGLAVKEVSANIPLNKNSLRHLTFLGLISFTDPVRPKVKEAIKRALSLGVRTVVVTGDHQGTAEAVSRKVGLNLDNRFVITGQDLSSLSDDQLKKKLSQIAIFARVSPEQKLRIAKIYQSTGEIVAMTGDGINDAPALKAANIGIAVGSGTEVAKSAADLIILDDNFETIVSAIEEGRRTVGKIKKIIVYLLSDVVDELALIGGALLTGLAIPLNALQILWVNLFSDSFPALGLAFEDRLSDLDHHPNRTKDGLIDEEMKFLILIIGISTSLLFFVLYYFLSYFEFDPLHVRTFIFASFGLYTLMLSFSIRSLKKSILNYKDLWDNTYLNLGAGLGIILMISAIYLPPLQYLLDTVSLPPLWFIGVLLVCFFNILAVEFGKWLYRSR